MASQVVTVTMSNPYADLADDNKIVVSWTSATGGTVSADIASTFTASQYDFAPQPVKLRGYIIRVRTNPGATAPTDDYDITLVDSDDVDVASGNLVDRDTATSEDWIPSDPPYVDGELTFTIASAGDEKTGTCTIFMVN